MARTTVFPLNISKSEQRTLHALAQGGRILLTRNERGDVESVECLTREGWVLTDCNDALFRKLKRRGLIISRNGGPYGITREGLFRLRPQLDNRVTSKRW